MANENSPRVTGNAIFLAGIIHGSLDPKKVPYRVVEMDAADAELTIEHENGNLYRVQVRQIGGRD